MAPPQPTRGSLRANGLTIELEQWMPNSGRRPDGTLAFLHGRFSGIESWRELALRLCEDYECWLVGWPHETASASDVANSNPTPRPVGFEAAGRALLKALRKFPRSPLVLIAHDLGCPVAQLIASTSIHPSVDGAVFLSPLTVTLGLPKLWPDWRNQRLRSRAREAHANIGDRGKTAQIEKAMGWNASSLKSMHQQWPRRKHREQWQHELRRTPCPSLILRGARDTINPLAHAEELFKLVPGAGLYEDPDSGHWPHVENPHWVSTKIRTFLSAYPHHPAVWGRAL